MGNLDEWVATNGADPYLVQRTIVREASGPRGYPGREVRLAVGWGASAPVVQTLVVDVGAGVLGSGIWVTLVAPAKRVRRSRVRPDREMTAELIFEHWAWFVEHAFDAGHVRATSIEQMPNGNWWVDGICDGLTVEAKFSADGRLVIARYKREGLSGLPYID